VRGMGAGEGVCGSMLRARVLACMHVLTGVRVVLGGLLLLSRVCRCGSVCTSALVQCLMAREMHAYDVLKIASHPVTPAAIQPTGAL